METKLGPIVTSTSTTHPETIKIATLTTIVTMTLPGTVVIAVVTAITPTMTTIDPEKAQRYLDPDLVTEETNATIAMTEMMTCSLMKMTNPFKTLWQHATLLLQTTPLPSNPLF